jgi:hypothetical protein
MSAGKQDDSAHGQVHPQHRYWPTVERGAPTSVKLLQEYRHARPGGLALGGDARILKGLQFAGTGTLLDGAGVGCEQGRGGMGGKKCPPTLDHLGVEHGLACGVIGQDAGCAR